MPRFAARKATKCEWFWRFGLENRPETLDVKCASAYPYTYLKCVVDGNGVCVCVRVRLRFGLLLYTNTRYETERRIACTSHRMVVVRIERYG